jgi:hypothetical protein
MKPLAQFRRFFGREFSLLLPPYFHARFFIPAEEKYVNSFNELRHKTKSVISDFTAILSTRGCIL